MAKTIKKIKIKKEDGSYTNYIPIGVEAKNVTTENGNNLETLIDQIPRHYNTLVEMKADLTLRSGDIAETSGYAEINDGGAARYLIIDNNMSYTPDEIYLVAMNNRNVVALLEDPNVFTNQVKCTEFYDEEEQSSYFITEIPYKNFLGQQNVWKLGIAEDNIETLDSLETTIDFANRKGATVCINAGIFAMSTTHRPWGVLIQNGIVLKDEIYTNLTSETLGIRKDGTFVTFNSKTATAQDFLNEGCINAVCAFTTIIKNGTAIPKSSTNQGPRQIIAQKPNKDYVILTASGRLLKTPGLSLQKVQSILINNYGVDFAYELDGGGSVSTVIDGQKINENIDDLCEDRHVSNFLYMGKPNITINKDIQNIYSLVSHLRQDMIKRFTKLRDIWYGYLFLRGPDSATTPGIEFYQQGERSTRSGKIWLNTDGFTIKQRPSLDSAERTLFSANNNGLYWNGNKLGQFYETCLGWSTERDLNDLEDNGFYLATGDTPNVPDNGNFIILHINTGPAKNNRVQFAFPMKDNYTYIWVRRMVNGQTEYKDWEPLSGWKIGPTNERPSDLLKIGQMYFDTSLDKPIWYDGAKWIEPMYKNNLAGKKLGALGDSLIYGNKIGNKYTTFYKIAQENNMTYINYGKNGNPLAHPTTGYSGEAMCERYINMDDDLDYIVVLGGANDRRLNVPIGTNNDEVTNTFKGALNILIKGLLQKYPGKKILFMTNYNRVKGQNSAGFEDKDYVDAMIEICALYGIPCFDNYRKSGISWYTNLQASWCDEGIYLGQSINHHFSPAGYDFLIPIYENLLRTI